MWMLRFVFVYQFVFVANLFVFGVYLFVLHPMNMIYARVHGMVIEYESDSMLRLG
jgi:hypothetical protein